MNRHISRLVSIFVLPAVWFCCAGYVQAQSRGTDPVLEWNNMLQAISTATSSGLIHSRFAMTAASIDASAGAFTWMLPCGSAHFALVHLLPDQQATLDAQYASSLAARRLTTSDPRVGIGEKAAARVLALRNKHQHSLTEKFSLS